MQLSPESSTIEWKSERRLSNGRCLGEAKQFKIPYNNQTPASKFRLIFVSCGAFGARENVLNIKEGKEAKKLYPSLSKYETEILCPNNKKRNEQQRNEKTTSSKQTNSEHATDNFGTEFD